MIQFFLRNIFTFIAFRSIGSERETLVNLARLKLLFNFYGIYFCTRLLFSSPSSYRKLCYHKLLCSLENGHLPLKPSDNRNLFCCLFFPLRGFSLSRVRFLCKHWPRKTRSERFFTQEINH